MMNHGMTPYESYMMAHKEGKRANGVGITGLVLGSVGLLAAVTGWVYAGSQAKKVQEIANAQNNGTNALLNQTAALLATEREGVFNCYALWIVMNAIHSDNGNVITGLMGLQPTDTGNTDYIKTIHSLAMNKLLDEDGVYNVRKYFLSE